MLTPFCVSPLGRFHTMSIMIAVDILGCTGSTEERAALLHKTIQLAAELKSTMGNMFSFAAVMSALEMTQVGGRSFSPHGLGSASCSKRTPLPVSCRLQQSLGCVKGENAQGRRNGATSAGMQAGKGKSHPLHGAGSLIPPGSNCFSVVGLFVLCWAVFLGGNESALQYNTNQSQGCGSSVSGPHCSLWKMKRD